MKLSIAFFACLFGAAAAQWDCDQRCSGYRACLQENANKRLLEEEDPSIIEDVYGNATWPIHHPSNDPTIMSSSNLRGGSGANKHRDLQGLEDFQLELYWEEGSCWQEEWEKREVS